MGQKLTERMSRLDTESLGSLVVVSRELPVWCERDQGLHTQIHTNTYFFIGKCLINIVRESFIIQDPNEDTGVANNSFFSDRSKLQRG